MRKQKLGNPKRKSRFICLRCLNENVVGDGIQRENQREFGHIKNLYCLCTGLQERTKNLEVRYCDNYPDMLIEAEILSIQYYDEERGESRLVQ